jgi:hypothetical protein
MLVNSDGRVVPGCEVDKQLWEDDDVKRVLDADDEEEVKRAS